MISSISARNIILAILFLACAPLVRANIGDDLSTLRGRYGGAKNVGGGMIFQHDGFSICVYFDGSHAAMEIYARDGSVKDKNDITQTDIDAILAKEAVGKTWNPITTTSGKETWLSSDNKLIARVTNDDKTGEKTLMIMLNSK